MRPGEVLTIEDIQACEYDVGAWFADHTTDQVNGFDACEADSLVGDWVYLGE